MVNSRLRETAKIWFQNLRSRLSFASPRDKKAVEAGGGPPIYCFVLFYCLNLLVQFDKLYP